MGNKNLLSDSTCHNFGAPSFPSCHAQWVPVVEVNLLEHPGRLGRGGSWCMLNRGKAVSEVRIEEKSLKNGKQLMTQKNQ